MIDYRLFKIDHEEPYMTSYAIIDENDNSVGDIYHDLTSEIANIEADEGFNIIENGEGRLSLSGGIEHTHYGDYISVDEVPYIVSYTFYKYISTLNILNDL